MHVTGITAEAGATAGTTDSGVQPAATGAPGRHRLPGLCGLVLQFLACGAPAGSLDPAQADPDWHIPVPAVAAASTPQVERLNTALADYRLLKRQGGWPAVSRGPALSAGERDPRVEHLRNRLRVAGDYRADMLADPWFFDAALDEALRRFQWRHGLPQTGTLDERSLDALDVTLDQRIAQLQATLERWRWLPEPAPRHVWINTAAATAELFEDGQPVLSMRTIVGHPSRATPSFSSALRAVVFNPAWSVPHSIAVADLLPRQQQDPDYLAKHNLRIFQYQGGHEHEIAPDAIDWSRLGPERFPFRLRQDPGAGNALGRIKLVMDNPFDIYLHDTPDQGLFDLSSRTLGSGCVRLEDARAFTTRLIAGERPWSGEDTDRHIGTGRTHTLPLHEPVPIYIVYLTAWADADGTVHFRRDLYGRDVRLIDALQARRAESMPAVSKAD